MKEIPEFKGKIATMEINELEQKLVELHLMIERKLGRINEIEQILAEQEYLNTDNSKILPEEQINLLLEEKNSLIEEKAPLEILYDAMLAKKDNVLTKKTLLN